MFPHFSVLFPRIPPTHPIFHCCSVPCFHGLSRNLHRSTHPSRSRTSWLSFSPCEMPLPMVMETQRFTSQSRSRLTSCALLMQASSTSALTMRLAHSSLLTTLLLALMTNKRLLPRTASSSHRLRHHSCALAWVASRSL